VSIRQLFVDADDTRELLTLKLRETDDAEFPARSLSEGTLRFLALCVLLEDASMQGVICMEEPENGIHPANLPAMVELVRDLAVDATDIPADDNPLRQVIINTHSPALVQLVDGQDLLFASTERIVRADGSRARTLRLRPMKGTWRARQETEPSVGKVDILPYLTSPPGAQLTIDDFG